MLDEADHMADLGFLPGVRRIMERTPPDGQRMLFSATLDAGVNVLVKRFLTSPVTHEADSAQSPVGTMSHHVFHVHHDDRLPVLLDLAAAPGRTRGLHPHQARRQEAGQAARTPRGSPPWSCTAT